ncbi:MAG: hypothetical protein IPH57_09925 [Saprospiraceae bacterium]|nr:hypothetical protein [Saprospiraceae bacterium]
MKNLLPLFFILFAGQFLNSHKLIAIDSLPYHYVDTIKIYDKVIDTFMTKGERKIAYLNFVPSILTINSL